jgi:hypothetical protein
VRQKAPAFYRQEAPALTAVPCHPKALQPWHCDAVARTGDKAKSRDRRAVVVRDPHVPGGGCDCDRLQRIEPDRLTDDPIACRVHFPERRGVLDRVKDSGRARSGVGKNPDFTAADRNCYPPVDAHARDYVAGPRIDPGMGVVRVIRGRP